MSILWIFLVIAGLVTILAGFASSTPTGWLCVVGVVTTWIVVGKVQSHIRGLARRARAHLGHRWEKGESVVHTIPERERLNVHHALESIRTSSAPVCPVLGMGPNAWDAYTDEEGERTTHFGLSLAVALKNNPRSEPIRYSRVDGPDGTRVRIPSNGFYRLTVPAGRRPIRAIAAVSARHLEILALDGDQAQTVLDHVLAEAARLSVYRGHVLSLEVSADSQADHYLVRFHDLPTAARNDIILPPGILELVERNIISVLQHANALKQAGFGARHGVLFYGPPGTGKSLVVRHICRSVPDLTVILLTGRQQQLIRESCRMARLLSPCLVVLEDVDLIATDRQQSHDTTLLHDLMDEMDGLGPASEVVFLLTTNRPEVLEKALTARPGRIDQAIHFPLPDAETRERLLRHFGRQVGVPESEVASIVERTDGASPAFLQELMRRATLMALEAATGSIPADPPMPAESTAGSETPEKTPPNCSDSEHTVSETAGVSETAPDRRITLNRDDFRRAFRELVHDGGPLTQQLLGFRPTDDH